MASAGKHYRHDDIEFWAEHGLIYVEDHRDDSFNTITVKDALKRAAVLSVEARRVSARVKSSAYSSGKRVAMEDRKKLLDCVENLINAAREARTQGDPLDPRVVDDLRKQRRKNILYPGASSTADKKVDIILPDGSVAGTGEKKPKERLWMP